MINLKDLEKYEYISFDIFDTLIKRNVNDPKDVFNLVEDIYNRKNEDAIKDFRKKRIECENIARKENIDEINIDMIYHKLDNEYSAEISEELKKIEIDVEIDITQQNKSKEIIECYNWALKNKKIIIISDMYLPKSVIEEILSKNNIKYDKLYLSSDIGKKKSNSELFKYVLQDLNINSNQIIHIGDNEQSDKIMANKTNINSILVPTKINKLTHYNEKRMKENINYNIIESFINNNIQIDNYFEKFGYECFGIMIYSFSRWLMSELEKENISKVYFLARDGKIMKTIFDILNPDSKIETYYMMASRRSIIVPSLWKCKNIYDVFSKIHIPEKITFKDLSKRLGLDDIDLNMIIDKYNIDLNKLCNFNDIKENTNLLRDLFPKIVENSRNEYEALKVYLKDIKFDNKVAIVDIGWFGNMQNALKDVSDADITGYYLGLRPGRKQNINAKGFLFDKNFNESYNSKELYFNNIFEFIFSATHGSVKKFIQTDKYVKLYESENEEVFVKNALTDLQQGAIKFSKDLYDSKIDKYINIKEIDSVINIFDLLENPNIYDAENFGNIKFRDGEISYIAKTLGIKKYIMDPMKLVKDFKVSLWKIGFLKRTFKVNLPYKHICLLLRKLKKEER